MPNIGPLEIAIVLVIVLIIFGPKRLPELGKSMGRGIREFRSSISGQEEKKVGEERRELEESSRAEAGKADAGTSDDSVDAEVVTEKQG